MKIKIITFSFVIGILAAGLLCMPSAAIEQYPCHQCDDLYFNCVENSWNIYQGCLDIGFYSETLCENWYNDDIEFCGEFLDECIMNCYECEPGGETGPS